MHQFFLDGGWGMYPTLVFGLILVGVGGLYAVRPERRFVPLLFALGILTVTAGGLGFVIGVMTTFTAAAHDDARGIAGALTLQGTSESLSNIALALGLTVIAAVAASLGALRLARSGLEVDPRTITP
jgi:hypothetical protein